MPDIDIDFSVRGPRARDPLRAAEVRRGRGRPDHHLRQDEAARRGARRGARARLRLRHRRPDREADPRADHGPQPELRGLPRSRARSCENAYDTDAEARRIVDVARGLEGIVRNNSIHAAAVVISDRPLTEMVPLQLAEDRGAAGEPAENGNGNGKPERVYKTVTQYSMGPIEEIGLLKMDFLGLADARRDRERGRHHRALAAASASTSRRCRSTTARPTRCSPAATRSACSSSSPRACRTRCGRSARPSSRTSSRWSRCTGRARCASSPTTRAASSDPGSVTLHRRAAARDHRADLRHRALPGAADADRARHRRLLRAARRTRCAPRSARRSAS